MESVESSRNIKHKMMKMRYFFKEINNNFWVRNILVHKIVRLKSVKLMKNKIKWKFCKCKTLVEFHKKVKNKNNKSHSKNHSKKTHFNKNHHLLSRKRPF